MKLLEVDWSGSEEDTQATSPFRVRSKVVNMPPTVYGIAIHPESEVHYVHFTGAPLQSGRMPQLSSAAPVLMPKGDRGDLWNTLQPGGYGRGRLVLAIATAPEDVAAFALYYKPRRMLRRGLVPILRQVIGVGVRARRFYVDIPKPFQCGMFGESVGAPNVQLHVQFGYPTVPPPATTYKIEAYPVIRHPDDPESFIDCGGTLISQALQVPGSPLSFGGFAYSFAEGIRVTLECDGVAAPTADEDTALLTVAVNIP